MNEGRGGDVVVERMNSFQCVIHRRNELTTWRKLIIIFFFFFSFLTSKYYYKFGDLTE